MLISTSDISTLKPASEVYTVSVGAEAEHEKASIARLINLAANTGEQSAIWEHPISADMKTLLLGMGYTVVKAESVLEMWVIRWSTNE